MIPGTVEAVPAGYEHVTNVYKAMMAKSTLEDEDGTELRIYEGHLTRVFKDLRLSVPYYTSIKNQLIGMGCIEQIRRGGGSATSRWILWKEPNLVDWKAAVPSKAKRGNKSTLQDQQIKNLGDRVQELERQLKAILEILKEQ